MECCRARHEKDDVIMINGQVIELEKAPRYRERDAVVDYQVTQALQDGDMMSMDEILQISSPDHPVCRAVQRDHVMLSARFDKEANVEYARMLARELAELQIRTVMVNTASDFGVATDYCLAKARIMVALCTSTYGQKTTGTYETYMELKFAREHPSEIQIVPVKLFPEYPPVPPGPEEGQHQNQIVFSPALLYVNGLVSGPKGQLRKMPVEQLATKIKEHIERLGLLSEVSNPQTSVWDTLLGRSETQQAAESYKYRLT
ncbi:unnamed protein product [Symbiodinium microadriaticum]|nr:unnamed protein product [Symbiodinium microadriaticum]